MSFFRFFNNKLTKYKLFAYDFFLMWMAFIKKIVLYLYVITIESLVSYRLYGFEY